MQNKIDEILGQRRAPSAPVEEPVDGEKFFSIWVGDAIQEDFIEFRFRNGLQTCFSYGDLLWFNHDPEAGCIDMEIGGFLITVKGRGLQQLFRGIKCKRVAWVAEADDTLQDHKANSSYVEEIVITPPSGFTEEEEG